MTSAHESLEPSAWVLRWATLVPAGGRMLDVACGRGRHARHFAALGCQVTAVDRDAAALEGLSGSANLRALQADLEGGPWPFAPDSFDAIVVANYLHRPLFDVIAASLAPGGVLIYETFMLGNERYGKPSNPDFLLHHDELFDAIRARGLSVVAFEQGLVENPTGVAVVQRACAVMPRAGELRNDVVAALTAAPR
jgi:SAM-dependent methyltransferase